MRSKQIISQKNRSGPRLGGQIQYKGLHGRSIAIVGI
jgi:hypothetical protein